MAKEVAFKNVSDQKFFVECLEASQASVDDMTDGVPKVFDNDFDDHAKYVMIDMYGMLFPDCDTSKKPVMFFRHTNKEKYRFGGFIELGDTYLSTQQGGHYTDIAQKDTTVDEYCKLCDDPLTYGIGTKEPFSEYRFYDGYSTWKEGDFFDVKAEPWPVTIYDHQSAYVNLSEIWQPAIITGTYEGKPVIGLGGYDRVFMRQSVNKDTGEDLGYFYVNLAGVREDGRREQMLMNVDFIHGKVLAYYWLEGEKPVLSDTVSIEADWVHLPYVDDGTCVYKTAVFRFGGKEIHFEGKWRSKGFTGHPRIERHGQSQVFGTFYEGNTPYKHTLFLSFNEQMEAYDHVLKKLGFDVID